MVDPIERWKLAEALTTNQIALLLAGFDPSEFSRVEYREWPDEVKGRIDPFVVALMNAVVNEKISANIIRDEGYFYGIDWDRSTIDVDSLQQWLISRNYHDGFFVSEEKQVDKIANPSSEFYAPKLAAAVRAWNEVTADPDALNGRTPKQALEMWLRKHANEYGLTDEEGNPNRTGTEEISKVANWKPAGGAAPTPVFPSSTRPALPSPREVRPSGGRKARLNSPTDREKPSPLSIDEDSSS